MMMMMVTKNRMIRAKRKRIRINNEDAASCDLYLQIL